MCGGVIRGGRWGLKGWGGVMGVLGAHGVLGGGPRGSLPAQQPPVLSAGRSSLGTMRSGWGPPSGFPPALGTPPTADIPWGPPRCRPHPFLCAPPLNLCPPPPQARGIDVQQVSLVINYDLPTNRENYIHR